MFGLSLISATQPIINYPSPVLFIKNEFLRYLSTSIFFPNHRAASWCLPGAFFLSQSAFLSTSLPGQSWRSFFPIFRPHPSTGARGDVFVQPPSPLQPQRLKFQLQVRCHFGLWTGQVPCFLSHDGFKFNNSSSEVSFLLVRIHSARNCLSNCIGMFLWTNFDFFTNGGFSHASLRWASRRQ